ncbi:MAG: hypothetical protein N838_02490 [Thiohalocapsa sp. PB-PSB1]|nr:MAG: hypothetical protein N838_02490 [Thiohalocapsa sp. PB-PSB1]
MPEDGAQWAPPIRTTLARKRIRSYLSTCMKPGVSSEEALRLLFEGRWPAFMGMVPA